MTDRAGSLHTLADCRT
jgi:hypothetical protein